MIDDIPDDQVHNIPGAPIQVRTYDAIYDPVTQGFVHARMRGSSSECLVKYQIKSAIEQYKQN